MKEPKFTKYIIFKDVSSMCSFCFYKLIEQQPILKHCKNCGRLFIADNKREFCNRILETGLTCYQTYTADTFKQRKQEEPLLREYMNAYRRVQNFCYKNKHLLSDETKTKIYEEIRKIYDVAQNDKTQNIEKYKQKFSWYCYDNLKTKYLN